MEISKTNNDDNTLNFFDYLGVILKHRKFIAYLVFLVVLITFLVSAISQEPYVANIRIWSNNTISANELLRSDAVLDYVIDELNLLELYNSDDRHSVRRNLSDLFEVETKKGGVFIVRVRYNEPSTAANIANSLGEGFVVYQKDINLKTFDENKLLLEKQWRFLKDIISTDNMERSIVISPNSFWSSVHYSARVLNLAAIPVKQERSFNVLKTTVFVGLIGLLFAILAAFLKEYIGNQKEKWTAVKKEYFSSRNK